MLPCDPMSSPESSSSAVRDESNGDLVGGLLTDAKELIDAHVDQLELEVRADDRRGDAD